MTTIFDNRMCELGEGPLWHPERGQLFWFDILGKRLLTRDGDSPRHWQFEDHVSAAGWVDRDTLLMASETGLYRFDLATGERDRVAPLEADNPVTRSNDGRADPMGGFWIGTMGKAAEPRAGAIYRYYRGDFRKVHDGITIPNAICFAPGGRRGYFTDTFGKRVMTQALDADGWPEGEAEVFLDLRAEGLNPDGAVVDSDGGVWNAQWGAGRVARYTAQGAFDRAIAVPGTNASCPAFGGPELTTLYVTTARENLDSPDDAQGCVYEAPAGITGLPEPRVIL
ncbi:SMP-30/gluconolactonase/LRE family protein [Mesobacterium pallidum]|uniref:SMP-30/gluconolactonase/LRE family protein n=1 Tax=Mesobacterium pallidum TaxID=2872037 RepID=UPI001EE35666|nr:SMP-30/gluconolactonase/LRE family protein [Mesobacterium pallidum]